MNGSITTRRGGLAALAERLERVAEGGARKASAAAAAEVLDQAVKLDTAEHIRTGELHRTARVVVVGEGRLVLEGPRYMRYVRGLRHRDGFDANELADARKRYMSETIKALRG